MKQQKVLRSPFVVTFAAGAAMLAGCGDTISAPADGGVSGDVPNTSDRPAVTDVPSPGCPSAAPAAGTTCALAATVDCNYGTPFNCPPSNSPTYPQSFRCLDSRWQNFTSTCNPPPPTCPATPPAAGASCVGALNCSYDSCQNIANVAQAQCTNGAWQLLHASCNPPPVDAGPPPVDAGDPPPPVCPSSPPAEGAACSGEAMCYYNPCTTPANVGVASCVGGAWRLGYGSCNPPPVDAG
ncbi:MAG: hypothetical protein JNK72_05900 [Myxococcales bacterium]|nr:hypothetical protein [Myxococcales bacterium]